MPRPRKPVDAVEVLRLRLEGHSWPEIGRRMRLGLGTVYRPTEPRWISYSLSKKTVKLGNQRVFREAGIEIQRHP